MKKCLIILSSICLFSLLNARIVRVPEQVPPNQGIQWAIDNLANTGDTVSVWGFGEPPFTYNENIEIVTNGILVVNRSYIENTGYQPSPEQVIIDGQGRNSVVKIIHEEFFRTIILKGFTIQHGISREYGVGAGIYIRWGSPIIENNIIKDNGDLENAGDGGGIGILGVHNKPWYTRPLISENVIQDNVAGSGGGIYYLEAKPEIISNEIVGNSARSAACWGSGGGILGYGDVNVGPGWTLIMGNQINSNSAYFGRALELEWSGAILRNNIIRHNTQPYPNLEEGIRCLGAVVPDLGFCAGEFGPGYNWLEDNGNVDISTEYDLTAQGNYWTTLNTSDIRSRVSDNVNFDPIAASDRVASVNGDYQACSTSVIVTGDLTINCNTFSIAEGKTFYFTTTDDAGTGDYKSCELLAHCALCALGTAEANINFTSFASTPRPGDWYGIRFGPNEEGVCFLNYCNINNAYCGIDGHENESVWISNSIIESNQVYGVKLSLFDDVAITYSKINSNIYGIFCDQVNNVEISNDSLLNNTGYGIFMAHEYSGANVTIMKNHIAWSLPYQMPTLYGIVLGQCYDNSVLIDTNKIMRWSQGGVRVDKESRILMNVDTIIDNTYYGIYCYNSSSPRVRWGDIERNQEGVHAEENSYPDLGRNEYNDAGNNSIDVSNYYYVVNHNYNQQDPIEAVWNWWGTDHPDPNKFVDNVLYEPWRTHPPEGGGQSAGTITTTPSFALYAPKPNPTNKDVRIAYSLPNRCKAELIIYNASGRIITKTAEEKEAGHYEYLWNRKDIRYRDVPNGVYFVRLQAGNNLSTQKVLLTR